MPVGKRIYSNFTRPSRELVEQFRGLPTANIADCMGRISCIDTEICPLNHTPLLGAALDVYKRQGPRWSHGRRCPG